MNVWHSEQVAVPPEICSLIDTLLPEAVPIRRRDFEVKAMMVELCERNGLVLPRLPPPVWPRDKPKVRVLVVAQLPVAAAMLAPTSLPDLATQPEFEDP